MAIFSDGPSYNEKPDRYAAAICIRVRPDGCCSDILSEKAVAFPHCEGLNDFKRYPRHECLWRRYFFFFLADFFAFFAFFAFLAMFSLRGPKSWFMQVNIRHAWIVDYTTIAKLILRVSKEGKRRSRCCG